MYMSYSYTCMDFSSIIILHVHDELLTTLAKIIRANYVGNG